VYDQSIEKPRWRCYLDEQASTHRLETTRAKCQSDWRDHVYIVHRVGITTILYVRRANIRIDALVVAFGEPGVERHGSLTPYLKQNH
jgi:hypothetical protein